MVVERCNLCCISSLRRPSAWFDPAAYLEVNPELTAAGCEPFLHYVQIGRAARAPLSKAEIIPPRPALTREIASATKRLVVVLTPGAEVRAGGVLSIAAIYQESEALSEVHGAKVALCAVPGEDPLFLRYGWFENSNYLLDLNAILRSRQQLNYLQIHIPEYAVNSVAAWLDDMSSSLLRNVQSLHLNVLLQNIDLIQGQTFDALKHFGHVTVTTAHMLTAIARRAKRLGSRCTSLACSWGLSSSSARFIRIKSPS